jgi:hypothetical protein
MKLSAKSFGRSVHQGDQNQVYEHPDMITYGQSLGESRYMTMNKGNMGIRRFLVNKKTTITTVTQIVVTPKNSMYRKIYPTCVICS